MGRLMKREAETKERGYRVIDGERDVYGLVLCCDIFT